MKEGRAKLESLKWIRRVRADSAFFAKELLKYLEELKLSYIMVARMTPWPKREARRVKEWRALHATYSVDEFQLKLLGWDRAQSRLAGWWCGRKFRRASVRWAASGAKFLVTRFGSW
jgi:hypothetical protein